MKVHARKPFSTGMRKVLQTLCGDFEAGRPPQTKYDPASKSMVEVSPGVPPDRLVEAASVDRRAEVDCEKCVSILAREDERAPMGDGRP